MNTSKILNSEIADLKISSLPSRPTAPKAFGGKGYTAADMKAAFDRLPLFIIEKFNSLLEDISSLGEGSIAFEIPSGIENNHTLGEALEDITTGRFAAYLSLGDETLAELKIRLAEQQADTDALLAICLSHVNDAVIDGGSPSGRNAQNGEVTQ